MQELSTFTLGYEWRVHGSIHDAFYYLSHIETWPDWWPQIVQVKTTRQGADEIVVGDSAVMVARSFLPYRLDWHTTVQTILPPNHIEVESKVVLGRSLSLTGVVSFHLVEEDGHVLVINRQVMSLSKSLPKWIHKIANRVFNFNHDYAMKRGAPGLQRLLATSHSADVRPAIPAQN